MTADSRGTVLIVSLALSMTHSPRAPRCFQVGDQRFVTSRSLKPLVCVPRQGGRPTWSITSEDPDCGNLRGPLHVAFADGELYVSQESGGRIEVFDAEKGSRP